MVVMVLVLVVFCGICGENDHELSKVHCSKQRNFF